MKPLLLLISTFFIHNTILAFAPPTEFHKTKDVQNLEYVNIMDEVLDVEENKLVKLLDKNDKIIILDHNFNKIREAFVEEHTTINNHSILVPIIYRSEFIMKVHNVSYFMLEKK